jgi:hypothetical protein
LNLVETRCGKLARTFLRPIRVAFQSGTQRTHPAGDCGNQRGAGRPPVEEFDLLIA